VNQTKSFLQGIVFIAVGVLSALPASAQGAGWTCDPTWFGDTFCDCGCGEQDSDCADLLATSCDFADGCTVAGTVPDPTNNIVCITPVCGNSIVEAPLENCDDGNVIAGDGCDDECRTEASGAWLVNCSAAWFGTDDGCDCGCGVPDLDCAGAVTVESCEYNDCQNGDPVEGTPHLCLDADCGNSIIDEDEQCDDGNANAGDGCSSACRTEFAFGCVNEPLPSVCTATVCGDSVVAGLERCDDGNVVYGDGCDGNCWYEAPATWTDAGDFCFETAYGDLNS
jgi:cysteine-rich repeat protein